MSCQPIYIYLSQIRYYYPPRRCGATPTENSCEWTVSTEPPYRNTAKKFTLVLTGKNEFGSVEQLFTVDHYSIIKPNVPQELSQTDVAARNISLAWRPPQYIEFEDEILASLVYQMHVTVLKQGAQEDGVTTIIDGITDTKFILTDLVPYTSYNVSLRCKTIQATTNKYWSNFNSIIVTTKQDCKYLPLILCRCLNPCTIFQDNVSEKQTARNCYTILAALSLFKHNLNFCFQDIENRK